MCNAYISSQMTTLIVTNSITAIILVINTILKSATISLVTWIGYDTHSEMMSKITNAIFIAQFFNTAILILMVNANFENSKLLPEFLKTLFVGPFLDYSDRWYATVGYAITQTMLINCFLGPILEIVGIVMKWMAIRGDQKWESDKHKATMTTKCTQIYQYLDVHSGVEHICHFKYSGLLNVCFVTMMYGAAIPILFPIAALTYFFNYVVERYHVAYSC
jgi:hypothetical protein